MMLHFVRGDGGMPVLPVSGLKEYLKGRIDRAEQNETAAGVGSACILIVMDLRDELEAIGR
jgi:hypothetical protein